MFFETIGATSLYNDSPLFESPQPKLSTGTAMNQEFQEYCAKFLSPLVNNDEGAHVNPSGFSRFYGESPLPSLRRLNSNGDLFAGDNLRLIRNESVYVDDYLFDESKREVENQPPTWRDDLPRSPTECVKLDPLPIASNIVHSAACSTKTHGSKMEEELSNKSDSPQREPSSIEKALEDEFEIYHERSNNLTVASKKEASSPIITSSPLQLPTVKPITIQPPTVQGCKCAKSHCLKLYCWCLASGKPCTDACVCDGCMNNEDHHHAREQAIETIKERNIMALTGHDIHGTTNQTDDVLKQLGVENNMKILRGCNCKRSGCKKRYCECFIIGKKCTSECQCCNCKNCDHVMPKKRVKVIKKASKSALYRKKPSIKIDQRELERNI